MQLYGLLCVASILYGLTVKVFSSHFVLMVIFPTISHSALVTCMCWNSRLVSRMDPSNLVGCSVWYVSARYHTYCRSTFRNGDEPMHCPNAFDWSWAEKELIPEEPQGEHISSRWRIYDRMLLPRLLIYWMTNFWMTLRWVIVSCHSILSVSFISNFKLSSFEKEWFRFHSQSKGKVFNE